MGFAIITGIIIIGGIILSGTTQDDIQRKKDDLYSKYYFESF